MGKKQKKKRREKGAGAEELMPNESVRRRASDTLIRIVSDNHTKLSAMAHIMLTLCAGIITVSITGIPRPWGELRVASFVTLGFALPAALFAILTILPRYSRTKVPSPDDPNFNLLFFSHFSALSEDEFTARMGRLATDPNQAQDALVRDLYQQGRMLAERKYRYLKICYRVFFLGILTSAVVGGWELLRN
jgi:hypothetical protein